ncbi:MAG: hypothetical protein GF331_23575, partial [Chitinivibrionales bacterium]|nr:hypothetical protein [Chitinivibrionales bacterium]
MKAISISVIVCLYVSLSLASTADDLRALTGGRQMKIAWLREVHNTNKFLGWGEYSLRAYDTRDGIDRDVLGTTSRMWRVKLSPDGLLIGYDTQYDTYVVQWDGQGNRKLLGGAQMGCFWYDQNQGTRYAFCYKGNSVVRVDIDNTASQQTVYSGEVYTGYLSISADGSRLGGEWPRCRHGIVDVNSGALTRFWDDECWSTITPDNTYRFLVFASNHRKWKVFGGPYNVSHELILNEAPGIGGYEVYHPRFAVNDPTIISVTGPYNNGLGGDASMAEVLVGKADAGLTQIQTWVYLTDNGVPDYHPSVWVSSDAAGSAPEVSTPALALTCTEGEQCSGVGTVTVTNLTTEPVVQESSPWLSIRIEGSGATRTLCHDIDATGLTDGDYTATITVSDGAGGASVSYQVTATIQAAESIVHTIGISPAQPTLEPGQSLLLSAQLRDAAGEPVAAQAVWSVSGGGTLTPAGPDAYASEHTATFSSNGSAGTFTLTIAAGDASASVGIVVAEVYTGYELTGPPAGSSVMIGQEITITWNAYGQVINSTLVEVSHNDGETWTKLTREGGVSPTDDNWAAFVWTVPEALLVSDGTRVPLASGSLLLRVRGYFLENVMDVIDAPLSVAGSAAAADFDTGSRPRRPSLRFDKDGALRVEGTHVGRLRVAVFNVRGDLCLEAPVGINGRVRA